MNKRSRCALTVAVAIAVLSLPSSLLAQVGRQRAPGPLPTTYQPPRLPDGQPDMQGAYTGPDTSRNLDKKALTYGAGDGRLGGDIPAYDRVWGVDRETQGVNEQGARLGTIDGPKIMEPADQTIPYLPEMQRKKVDVFSGYMLGPKGDITKIDPMVRCHGQGPPRSNMMLNYNGYHIVQPPGYVVILSETNHLYRAIPLDGRPHLTKNIGLYMGDSRGRWEGNTLIVETTNRVDGGWLDMSGSFHSDQLHVVERYTIVGPKRIEYEATITDPKVFLRPWKLASFFDTADADYEIYEFACTEGNKAVENLMAESSPSADSR